MVKIDASRCKIFNLVLSRAVTAPAANPPRRAARTSEKNGLKPWVMATAETAEPRGRLPSTVKIREIQHSKRQVDPQDHGPVNQALLQGADERIPQSLVIFVELLIDLNQLSSAQIGRNIHTHLFSLAWALICSCSFFLELHRGNRRIGPHQNIV